MTKAKAGDTVSVDYTLRTVSGDLIDTSAGRLPIRFILGSGDVIPGLDQAVLGMELGESKQ
ncbi:MAG: FKBP-type peptidyl-prolyl cis-trans isomerase [Bryobacterales bacterium]